MAPPLASSPVCPAWGSALLGAATLGAKAPECGRGIGLFANMLNQPLQSDRKRKTELGKEHVGKVMRCPDSKGRKPDGCTLASGI
jgi:hypothetical protein